MKHYNQGQGLNQKILNGVNILADNVATTLGPRGRNVALYHKEQNVPVITKDGVTVAKFVSLEDPFENRGSSIMPIGPFHKTISLFSTNCSSTSIE